MLFAARFCVDWSAVFRSESNCKKKKKKNNFARYIDNFVLRLYNENVVNGELNVIRRINYYKKNIGTFICDSFCFRHGRFVRNRKLRFDDRRAS